ncbi:MULTISPECIES: energy transducer TonB [Flavobacterium]|uniref:TonB C-terminal domain-containing protein n=1 Tax=Flavobacterium hankyongi TaxID=1176532 RepID=A0ABP8ZV36_9FLAO|nr:energy transducer TonB [Flavobacterium sp. N1846]
MKKIFFLVFILFPAIVVCQIRNKASKTKESNVKKDVNQIVRVEPVFDENHIYDYPKNANLLDSFPEYLDGAVKFDEDFNKAFNPAVSEDLKGKILIEFIIEKDGSLTHFKVLRNLGQQMGTEAIKTIQSLKKWKPGTRHKKPVRTKYMVPIQIDIKANISNEETRITR